MKRQALALAGLWIGVKNQPAQTGDGNPKTYTAYDIRQPVKPIQKIRFIPYAYQRFKKFLAAWELLAVNCSPSAIVGLNKGFE